MKDLIEVKKPFNQIEIDSIFDRNSYSPYRPKAIKNKGKVLITRIGFIFAFAPIFYRETIYKSWFVFIRTLLISFASIFKRGFTQVDSKIREIAIIHSPWTAGYYHWVTESIPRTIAALKSEKNIEIILPDKKFYSRYEQTLHLIGVRNIEYFPNGKNIIINSPILTTCPDQFGTTDPEIIREIRSLYWKALNIQTSSSNNRVYVSRKLARGRKVINEDEVIQALSELGFECIVFEDYCFSDQVKLMSATKFLVGIHGAGLTNMIFMPPKGNIIELMPCKNGIYDFNLVRMSLRHDPCYLRLASALDHDYVFQQCSPKIRKFESTHMADIFVDINLLRYNLEILINKEKI